MSNNFNNFITLNQKDIKKKYKIRDNNIKLIKEVDISFVSNNIKEIENCGSRGSFLQSQIVESQNEKLKSNPNITCKNKLCLICNSRLSTKGYYKLLPIIEFHKANKISLDFITLTFPNIPMEQLNHATIKKINLTYHKLLNNLKNRYKEFLCQIRKAEFTFNGNTMSGNYHYHIIVPSIKISKLKLQTLGTNTYHKHFDNQYNTKNLLNVDIRKVKFDKLENEMTAYVSKTINESFAKKDLIRAEKRKIRATRRKDKQNHHQNNISALNRLKQEQITRFIIKWLQASKNIRIFTISKHGEKQEIQKALEKFIQIKGYAKDYENHEMTNTYFYDDFMDWINHREQNGESFEKIKERTSHFIDGENFEQENQKTKLSSDKIKEISSRFRDY